MNWPWTGLYGPEITMHGPLLLLQISHRSPLIKYIRATCSQRLFDTFSLIRKAYIVPCEQLMSEVCFVGDARQLDMYDIRS